MVSKYNKDINNYINNKSVDGGDVFNKTDLVQGRTSIFNSWSWLLMKYVYRDGDTRIGRTRKSSKFEWQTQKDKYGNS